MTVGANQNGTVQREIARGQTKSEMRIFYRTALDPRVGPPTDTCYAIAQTRERYAMLHSTRRVTIYTCDGGTHPCSDI
jgi:hypothetical protein